MNKLSVVNILAIVPLPWIVKMAQNYGFLVCIFVLVLDIVAGILGIQAEIAQNKVLLYDQKHVYIYLKSQCWWEKRTLSNEPCFDVLGWKQVKDLKMWALVCRDPNYEAFKLGVCASIFLVFAHAFAHLLGRCICMRSKEECERATANRQLAVAFLILSWYVFFNMCCFSLYCCFKSHVICYHKFLLWSMLILIDSITC